MIMSGNEFGTAVCKAMGIDPANVHRVVIDAACDSILQIYVQYHGGEEILSALELLHGGFAEITVSGKETE